MSDETAPFVPQWDEPSAGVDGVETLLAWSAETDDDEPAILEPEGRPLPRSLVALLAGVVVCAVGLSAFVVGQYAVSTPHPGAVHTAQAQNQPAVEELAPPAPAAVPHRAHLVVATPPNAPQTFAKLLGKDGFVVHTPAQAAAQAQASCAYLAQGGTMGGLIDGTAKKSPGTTRAQDAQVTRDGVQAFCPQYANR